MPNRYDRPAEGWNQNRQRGRGLFHDQHHCDRFPEGRPWWCWTERPADGAHMPRPTGDMMPYGWSAPWLPESQYMRSSYETLETTRFTILYDEIITEYRQAMRDYYMRAAQEAAAFNLPIPDYGEALGWKLRAIVGRPPRSPRIPEAAKAGDAWILGFRGEPNEYLQRLIVTGDLRISVGEKGEEMPIERIINRTAMPDDERDALLGLLDEKSDEQVAAEHRDLVIKQRPARKPTVLSEVVP